MKNEDNQNSPNNYKEMINVILRNVDNEIKLKENIEGCLFCNSEVYIEQQIKLVFRKEDFLIKVPMCYDHFEIFDRKDEYHYNINSQ